MPTTNFDIHTINNQVVDLSRFESNPENAALIARFGKPEIRTVLQVVNDRNAYRVAVVFNGTKKRDGTDKEVGLLAELRLYANNGKTSLKFKGVKDRLQRVKATIEQEIAQLVGVLEGAIPAGIDPVDTSNERFQILFEQLDVLMLFEKWIKEVDTAEEAKVLAKSSTIATATASQEVDSVNSNSEHTETKEILALALALASQVENILSNNPKDISKKLVDWKKLQLAPAQAIEQALVDLHSELLILEAGGVTEKRLITTSLQPMITRLEQLIKNVHEQLIQNEAQKILDEHAGEIAKLNSLVADVNSLPSELSADKETIHDELNAVITTLKSTFDNTTDSAVRQILYDQALSTAINASEQLSLKRAKLLMSPLIKRFDDANAFVARGTNNYISLVKELGEVETVYATILSTIRANPMLNVKTVDEELVAVEHQFESVKKNLEIKIDVVAVAEFQGSALVAELSRIVTLVETINEDDLLQKGQAPKVGGKNLGHSELVRMEGEIKNIETDLTAAKLWGETDFQQSPQAEKLRQELTGQVSRAKIKLKDLIAGVNVWEKPQAATRAVADFFEGGYLPFPQEWKNGEWRTENPELLAKAIWKYVYEKIIMAATKEDLPFMQLTILEERFRAEGQAPKIKELLDSFAALDIQLQHIPKKDGSPRKQAHFAELAEKLGIDFSELEQIYRLGYGVNRTEQNPTAMVEFLTTTGNQMLGVDLERTYSLGKGYFDEPCPAEILSDRIPPADRILWAQQAYFAMNDPSIVEWGYIASAGKAERDVLMKNIGVKNNLSIFPSAATDASKIKFGRDAVRILIGSSEPPEWIKHPLIRGVNESWHGFALRRKEHIAKIISDKLAAIISACNARAEGVPTDYEKYLTLEDQNARRVGYFPEQVSMNLGEYALEPCRAEATKVKSGSTTKRFTIGEHTIDAAQIEPNAGPASIFFASRWFYSGPYRRKLTSESKAEGSPGPRVTISDFHELLQTMYDYYQFTPPGENVGATLKELILTSNKATEMAMMPYEMILSSTSRPGEGNDTPWSQMVKLAPNHYNRIVNPDSAIAINWQGIRQAIPGLEGQFSFNPGAIRDKLMAILREITYMMQRDMGLKLKTWDTDVEHQQFLDWEKVYLQQVAANQSPSKPALCPVEIWNSVIEVNCLRKPSHLYEVFDIQNPEGPGVVRYYSKMRSVVNMPVDESMMSKFEKAVLKPANGRMNDHWSAAKKLFFGKLIIGSMVSSGVDRISFKDSGVILEVLAYDSWIRANFNWASRLMRALRGVKAPTYEGLGLFTEAEAKALMEDAGVSRGFYASWQDYVEALQAWEGASGGGRR